MKKRRKRLVYLLTRGHRHDPTIFLLGIFASARGAEIVAREDATELGYEEFEELELPPDDWGKKFGDEHGHQWSILPAEVRCINQERSTV